MIKKNGSLEEWEKTYLNDTLGFAYLMKEANSFFELFIIFDEEKHLIDYYWVMN